MSKRKRNARATNVVKGKPLNVSAGEIERYQRALLDLTRQMLRETKREIGRLFRSDEAEAHFAMDASIANMAKVLTNRLMERFSQLFDAKATPFAERVVKGADRASKASLRGSLKDVSEDVTLKFTLGDQMRASMEAMVTENVGLIKSIPEQYLQKVQGAVMRSITSGNGLQTVMEEVEKYDGITERRAKFIAEDQTRKAYNGINRIRMQRSGVRKFEWLHTGGSQHPRQMHIDMSGNIYSFDDPPVIDEAGNRGFPGDAPGCRCRMVPVVDFEEDDDE